MNVFFGKISYKHDIKQLEAGYYHAIKDSKWFNGLKVNDYVFMIGNGKIQLWKAKEWANIGTPDERLNFDILSNNLDISIKDLVRFKYFKLTVDLIVKTTRSTAMETKAFFPLSVEESFTEEMLLDTNAYKNKKNQRGIFIYDNKSEVPAGTYNISLFFDNGNLQLNEIKNSDSLLLQKFKPENVKYLGRGSSQKDKTIAIILAKDNRRKDLTEVIGIKELYDCLMCKYDVEDSETQYWVVNGLEKEKIEFCLENSVFVMQFQYGIQRNSVVSRQLNKAKKVKEGDKVLLFNENRYYAYGTFIKCEIESTKEKTLAEQVDNKTKNENGEIITYTDAPCYFEDLTDTNGFDGKFGQRLSIDSWENSNTDGLSIPGIMENIDFIQDTILKLKDDTFYKLVKNTLSGEIKNIMELEKIKELTELLEYKSQIILQGPPGTGKTYTAKDIAEVMIFEDLTPDKKLQKKKLEESNQFKLVQFHPSYSYEDFVRGITSEVGNSAVPEFVTKNKIFCEFATIAYKNFIDSQNHLTELSFGNHESSPSTKTELKKFVLIIDEINRANLPSVLGELIYALEYRGDTVESMYEIKGEGRTIIVPPNLYVIGTMNTADRSVGHIDYAIKRRFAFKNVLPNEDVITNEKAKELFKLVSILFEKDYLAPDFNKEDVQIGHSYFIVKDENELKLKIQYEIAPLLNEYVKDGLLMENAKVYIKTKIMNFVV